MTRFLVLTKTKEPVIEEHLGEVRPDRVTRTLASVERVWRAVEAGHFYPAPSVVGCASCGYRQACEGWRGKNGPGRPGREEEQGKPPCLSLAIGGSLADPTMFMPSAIGIGGPSNLEGLRALMQTAWTHLDRLISAVDRLMAAMVWSVTQGSRSPGG